MSRWDIFRWRTLAGGRWCPVGTVQRLTEPAGESAPLWGAERASCQRPPPMGCIEALAGCPLSHGCRRASVSAAASVGRWATSHRDVAAPKGGAK